MIKTPLRRSTKPLKRIPLKRKVLLKLATAKALRLKTYKPLKRSPIKSKPKRNPIPKGELAKVDERAGNKCEYCGYLCAGGILDYAHVEHRGMGGVQGNRARAINDHRNIAKLCRFYHDIMDRRRSSVLYPSNLAESIKEELKQKISWHEWEEENKDVIKR